MIVIDSIVDQNRRMHQLADSRQSDHRTPDIRKASEQINVIEERDAETFGGPGNFDQE